MIPVNLRITRLEIQHYYKHHHSVCRNVEFLHAVTLSLLLLLQLILICTRIVLNVVFFPLLTERYTQGDKQSTVAPLSAGCRPHSDHHNHLLHQVTMILSSPHLLSTRVPPIIYFIIYLLSASSALCSSLSFPLQ